MKRFHKLIGIVLSLTMITLISGCGGGGGSSSDATAATTGSAPSSANTKTGVLSLNITDAPPKLGDDVTEVNIAVIGITYNYEGKWTEVTDFVPQTFNLLELQNGHSLHLGDLILPAGHYTEIRFKLAAPEKVGDVKSNPDCNITFADGSSVPLFVPSGGQSGYKGKGAFDITADAKIEIMADFDVHKSIVVAGNSGKYLLKPVIRLIVNELSGEIHGTVVDVSEYSDPESLVVYSYKDGSYEADEINEIDGIRFLSSVSSSDVNMTDGNFTLSFLGEGNYTLVTALYDGTGFIEVVDREDSVEVFKGETVLVDLNTSD